MEKWILRNRNTLIENLEFLNISPNVLKILINRGFKNFDEINNYINPDKNILKDASCLKDFSKAINILKDLKDSQDKIRIVGDYDVDGVISVYLLYTAFRDIGLNVDFVIPDRVKDGYGINYKIVEEAHEDGVKVIITCDNGIAAIDVVKFAKEIGMTVIVTDHHDIQMKMIDEKTFVTVLPNADAILNPKQEDCTYEFKKLCGAGVCFKLCSELYRIFDMENKIEDLLEFVAIATICDVVDLEDENRFIVKRGIELINNTKNIGLNAIIEANSLVKGNISSYEIGFIIGPCLNALGRLESAQKGIELLLSDDNEKAYELALEIKKLNDTRKVMTVNGVSECINIIQKNSYEKSKIIVIYNENIHESIAGIIAGRIKEKYYKPTIVITKGEEFCKGSARSIENINIFELLSDNKNLLKAFGGHPMAAGLSLDEKNIDLLRENLNKSIKINEEDFVNVIYVDMFCPIQNIDYKFVKELSLLEPFGKSNSKPILGDKRVRICCLKRIGKNQNYISLKLISKDNKIFDFVYFGDAEEFDEKFKETYGDEELRKLYSGKYFMNSKFLIDVLYEVKIDTYNFNETIKYFLFKYRF
ncbi:MAG TPA: single-stranded-DNA-specific exonuclease RecJ [Candidatus Dwaynia gallinarum]|mgnify:FL=1|nr:single-stranded-DNA-specific exonuclease RecJ [Candidatus Dwaynia gallinarum]